MQKEIAVSLYLNPATFKELAERDFLKDRIALFWIDTLLMWLLRDGWIYERGGVYYTYKRTAKRHLKEWDLA